MVRKSSVLKTDQMLPKHYVHKVIGPRRLKALWIKGFEIKTGPKHYVKKIWGRENNPDTEKPEMCVGFAAFAEFAACASSVALDAFASFAALVPAALCDVVVVVTIILIAITIWRGVILWSRASENLEISR